MTFDELMQKLFSQVKMRSNFLFDIYSKKKLREKKN